MLNVNAIRRAFVRLVPWVLVFTILGCESREGISRRVARFFLPSRTLVIYFPAASLGSSSQLVRSWGNDSVVVTLKEGDRWEPAIGLREFAFTILPCADADSVCIRFDERNVLVVPPEGPWFAEDPLRGSARVLKIGRGPVCLVAGGYVDAEPRVAVRLRGPNERFNTRPRIANGKVTGRLLWGPTGGPVPRTLWTGLRTQPLSGIVMAEWTKRWAAADSNGYFELDSLPQGPVRLVARVRGIAGGSAVAMAPGVFVTIRLLRDPIEGPSTAMMGAWPTWADPGGMASARSRGSIAGHYRGSMSVIGNYGFPELRDLEFDCDISQPSGRSDTAHVVFFRPYSPVSARWFEMPLMPEGTNGAWAGFVSDVTPMLKWVLIQKSDAAGRKRIEGRVYPGYGGEMIGRVDMQQWSW